MRAERVFGAGTRFLAETNSFRTGACFGGGEELAGAIDCARALSASSDIVERDEDERERDLSGGARDCWAGK